VIAREEALALVRERIDNANLVNHSVAVEVLMEAVARSRGLSDDEVERWALAGLLHDLDYADTAEQPERHGLVTVDELGERIDAEMAHAILAHADKAPRETDMDRALYCTDPTTGFIVAAALVRPDKDVCSVELRSLLKRWKEKSFARGADREQMAACEELGMTREEFLALALTALQARHEEIGL
jgi:putative nucleotidyltransferase with HDIG domain